MTLEIKGKIKSILPVETGESKSGKAWKKQSFVIDTGDQYNPDVCFSVFGDEKVDNLSKFNKEGQDVTVKFNVSSKEFNGKWYHSLDAWYIGVESNDSAKEPIQEESKKQNGKKKQMVEEEPDNLPF